MDRVDIEENISLPDVNAAYEILRSSLADLAKCGIVAPECRVDVDHHESSDESYAVESLLPSFQEMELNSWTEPDEHAKALLDIAKDCQGATGRWLRRLPALSIARYTHSSSCSFSQALAAMTKGVEASREGLKQECTV
ncbi:hypothetical protein L228DRAFT_243357 [Xylona heveae TC161]|uniref:Pachytene checkpoint protein 2 C-terminal domain-containing protein n=1 Tax=Xylona heveae (strain CBS 132557 / TC161) TaxID=1328760 RepID=A0A165JZW8_XYLHT|nr:hypothetical protein L228DRAFT_243357 [Xylona heveae TC161]KZF26831.1 hypothetical protein L228DRAFT_243357 [Xylona heveae TC161]